MRTWRPSLGLIPAFIAAGLLFVATTGSVQARQTFDNAWNLCAQQTQTQERRHGIPRHLLSAISLAESGRWDASRRAIVAWPWTVTVFGEGRFYDTKAEALADVEVLRGRGVTNIDVGCMQINLHFHGDAFDSLSDALEPVHNAAYGADFLKRLYDDKRSWTLAAGRYHSATPARGQYYRRKVTRLWAKLKGLPNDLIARVDGKRPPQVQASQAPQPPGPAPTLVATAEPRADLVRQLPRAARYVDAARTKQLNAALARRRAAQQTMSLEGRRRVDTRRQQLAAWRQARTRPEALQHLLALRTAELQRKRKDELQQLMEFDGKKAFADRRRKQLKSWRKRRYVVPAPAADAEADPS